MRSALHATSNLRASTRLPFRTRLCLLSAAAASSPRLIADLQVLPSPKGNDASEFAHVEAAIRVIAASGLDHSVNALGTTVEGPADEVWATARAAFDACLESGADSNMMYLKIYQGERTVDELQTSGRAAASESVGANANDAISAAEKNAADLRYEQRTKVIHAGSRELPPLIEVPGGDLPLQAVVKPPDADTLWQWEENRGNVDADSSWASVWPAAANLAHLLANEAALVKGRRVVELGAGLGIAGLTAAKTGAKSVTLIDREPLALHCAMSTAVVCGLETGPVPDGTAASKDDGDSSGGIVSASVADWGKLAEQGLVADVVLASEVLYDPNEAEPLARSIASLLPNGGTLLLADPAAGRVESARAAAAKALEALGATVSETPLEPPPAGDGWYAVRAGDGSGQGVAAFEPIVLLRAEF